MTIIGVMVAYQEAAYIGEALQSLLTIGCERLVVVDGAWNCFPRYDEGPHSTDGTQEIARSLGAEVIPAPEKGWKTQVRARNAYFVGQPGDWYFILDADERVIGRLPARLEGDALEMWRITPGIVTPDRIMRLVKEDGTLKYCYTHYALFRQGRIIDRATTLDSVMIAHPGRPGDVDRDQRRDIAWARNTAEERARIVDGWVPSVAVEEWQMDKIAYRYIGGERWVPGIPARDLTVPEAVIYSEQLARHLATARPIYEPVEFEIEDLDEPESEQPAPEAQAEQEQPAPEAAPVEKAGRKKRNTLNDKE